MSVSSKVDHLARLEPCRLGEIVETTTTGYWAESEVVHSLPDLGQLVRVELEPGEHIYGVVAFGQTGGIDPGRRAVRRGSQEIQDAAIYARHPELQHILRTLFQVAAIGFTAQGKDRHAVPRLPVPLHYSVCLCSAEETRAFCDRPAYFPILLNGLWGINPEQLLASHLTWVDETLDDGHHWLNDAARRVARLMKRDYDQLITLLETVDPAYR